MKFENLQNIVPGAKKDQWFQDSSGGWIYRSAIVQDKAVINSGTIVGGNAVIENDAIVENSIITSHAIVRGESRVYDSNISGNALIDGSAMVTKSDITGRSVIEGQAVVTNCTMSIGHIHGTATIRHCTIDHYIHLDDGVWERVPFFMQGPKFKAFVVRPGYLAIGCEVHSLEYWDENVEQIAETYKCSKSESDEYRNIVDAAIEYENRPWY